MSNPIATIKLNNGKKIVMELRPGMRIMKYAAL